MKLYYKVTLINVLTRIMLISAFLVFVPGFIYHTAVSDIDLTLQQKEGTIFHIMDKKGMGQFMEVQSDSTFADYTIFKENFVSIERVKDTAQDTIVTSPRDIENEVVECRVLKHYFKYGTYTYLLEIGESIQYIKDLNQVLRQVALYLLLAFSVITVIIDLLATQYLLRPLQRIEAKLLRTRHPERFDFNKKLKTTTTDFRYLDSTINDMMRKIRNAFNIEKEFIANVSHELLTPISILQTRLENMLRDSNLDEEAEQKIIDSLGTLGRLKQIIRSLLLISQVENNQAPKEDTVHINDLIREVISEIEVRFTEKNLTLEMNLQDDFTFSPCNRSLLFNMFFNLVNNAIKYNKTDGNIIISSLLKQKKQFEVRIQDTGKGIAPEHIQSIFYRFKKFNASGEESYGLGLPMVKTIADFHRIDIKVDSKPGEGSVFTLIFKEE